MKNAALLLSLSLLAYGLPASPRAGQALSFSDCVKEASTHNLDLLSAEQSLKAADNAKLASLGQFLPQINLNGSLNRSGSDTGIGGALNDPNYSSGAHLSLSASENLFSGFKDISSVDSANAQLDLARAQLTQAKAQLSHDLKSSFYNLLYSQKQIDLLQAIADRNKANQDLVEMNYKGGTDNKGSLQQAQAAYQESVFEVDQAKRGLRLAQRQLAQLLGRALSDSLEVSGSFDVPALAKETPDFQKLVLQTPAHLQSLAQLHLSESQYVSSRGNFLPTLSANAALSRDGSSFDDMSPSWNAGLSLNFPLFTGGRDFFNLKSAEESKYGAEDNLRNTDLKTASSLESAFTSFQNAVENTQVQEGFLTAAQTREEIAKAEYLNGLLTFQNWDDLETNLTSQQKSELSSYLSAKTAEANWELTQGKGVIP
ncbi:MAG TPA: TolC family protein [bacterium]|nr:TolC family protein [bacterium]